MNSSYSLDEYVRDLRTITAQKTDPINIADRVAPLAKKFAQTPGWVRPEYRECDAEQGFGVHLLHEEPNLQQQTRTKMHARTQTYSDLIKAEKWSNDLQYSFDQSLPSFRSSPGALVSDAPS